MSSRPSCPSASSTGCSSPCNRTCSKFSTGRCGCLLPISFRVWTTSLSRRPTFSHHSNCTRMCNYPVISRRRRMLAVVVAISFLGGSPELLNKQIKHFIDTHSRRIEFVLVNHRVENYRRKIKMELLFFRRKQLVVFVKYIYLTYNTV